MPSTAPRPTCLALLLALSSCAGTSSTDYREMPYYKYRLVDQEKKAEEPAPRQDTARQAAENRARPYLEGTAALERYRASPDLENDDSRTVQERIADLEKDTGRLTGVITSLANEARDRHTSLAFGFADTALQKGALDVADRTYRRLVEFYVGNLYAGIRDRARLGIDDVRERRAAAPR